MTRNSFAASSDKNASKEILNETENLQESESLSKSEHNVTLHGDREYSEDTSTNNIYSNETQKISEENYSLFMANTQKITGSLSRNETLPSQLAVPSKLSILLEETQKISSSLKVSEINSSEDMKQDNLQKLDESNVKVWSAKEESDDEDFFLPTQLTNEYSRVHPQVYASAEVETTDISLSPNEHDATAPIACKVTNITISEAPNLQLEDSLEILNTTCSTDLNVADEIEDSFDRKSSSMSENLLAEINSDDERTQEMDISLNDKKKFSDDEYEEVYEGATQILKSYDEKSFTPEKYCATQHDNEKEDTILSSQESTCFEKSKTDLLIKTMSLTQNVCDVSKECLLETQYDIVDMTLATQSKAQDSKDKKFNDTPNDKRPSNENSKSNNVSIHQDSPFDSDEDSIDYLASTQELMDGLVEKERTKEGSFDEIEQEESIFEKENMTLQTKCNHNENTKASKKSTENFTIESSEQEIVEKKNGLKIDIDNKTFNSNFSDENKSYSVQKTKSGYVTQSLKDFRKVDTLFSEGESNVNFEKKTPGMDRPIAQSSSKLNSKSTENDENQCQCLPNKKVKRKESTVNHEFSRTNDNQPKEIEIEHNKCMPRRSSRNRATKLLQQKMNEASILNKKSSLPNSNDCSKTIIENSLNKKRQSKSVESIPRRSLRAKSISSVNEKAIVQSVEPKKLTKRKTSNLKLETVTESPQPSKRVKHEPLNENVKENTTHSPASRKRKKHIVMFTGYDDPQHQRYMKDLGAEIASAKNKPTVLVTDKVRRTEKLLCALGRGIPIVSREWVTRSKSVNTILDPYAHIIEDIEIEKKYGFNMKKSIDLAAKSPLLSNYKIYATKSCQPAPKEIKEIVECAGGTSLKQIPRKNSCDVVIISCPEDKIEAKKAVKSGFNVQDKEFLLTGLLKQSLDFDSHKLSAV